mgnify:CR=1 FL=1
MLLLIICLNHVPDDFLNCLGERTNLLGSELNDVLFVWPADSIGERTRLAAGKKKYKKSKFTIIGKCASHTNFPT